MPKQTAPEHRLFSSYLKSIKKKLSLDCQNLAVLPFLNISCRSNYPDFQQIIKYNIMAR